MTTRHLSMIKPTGHLGLGHLLGALRPMAAGQDAADCFYGIADLHALTTPHQPAKIRAHTAEMAALFLAAGLDRATSSRRAGFPLTPSSVTCWSAQRTPAS